MGEFYLFATLDDEDLLVVLGVLLLVVGFEHVFKGGFAVVRLVSDTRNVAEMAQENLKKNFLFNFAWRNRAPRPSKSL